MQVGAHRGQRDVHDRDIDELSDVGIRIATRRADDGVIIGRRVSANDRIWLDTTQRTRSLLVDLPEERLATPVPAVGGRPVHDLFSLLAETAADALAGRLHGVLDFETGASRPLDDLLPSSTSGLSSSPIWSATSPEPDGCSSSW
jgi:hypothetical protein